MRENMRRTEGIDSEKVPKAEKKLDSIIRGFIGKELIVTLRSKNKLKGKLESVSQYEFILTISYKPVLVMKHAVDYIEFAE